MSDCKCCSCMLSAESWRRSRLALHASCCRCLSSSSFRPAKMARNLTGVHCCCCCCYASVWHRNDSGSGSRSVNNIAGNNNTTAITAANLRAGNKSARRRHQLCRITAPARARGSAEPTVCRLFVPLSSRCVITAPPTDPAAAASRRRDTQARLSRRLLVAPLGPRK